MLISEKIIPIYRTISSAIPGPFIALGGVVWFAISFAQYIHDLLVSHNWIEGKSGDPMSELFSVPYWAWGIIFVLGYFSFWILRYAHKLRVQIEEGYKDIADLREKGVAIRNRGQGKFTNEDALLAWVNEVEDWNNKTILALKKINVSIGVWFKTLDVVPNCPRVPVDATNEKHLMQFRMHDRRLDNLGHLIRDLWGIEESKK